MACAHNHSTNLHLVLTNHNPGPCIGANPCPAPNLAAHRISISLILSIDNFVDFVDRMMSTRATRYTPPHLFSYQPSADLALNSRDESDSDIATRVQPPVNSTSHLPDTAPKQLGLAARVIRSLLSVASPKRRRLSERHQANASADEASRARFDSDLVASVTAPLPLQAASEEDDESVTELSAMRSRQIIHQRDPDSVPGSDPLNPIEKVSRVAQAELYEQAEYAPERSAASSPDTSHSEVVYDEEEEDEEEEGAPTQALALSAHSAHTLPPTEARPSSELNRVQLSLENNDHDATANFSRIRVRADGLDIMLRAMSGPKWTGLGPTWALDFEGTKPLQKWFDGFASDLPLNLKELLKYSHALIRLFKRAPCLFEQSSTAQQAYFAAPETAYRMRESIKAIRSIVLIQDINNSHAPAHLAKGIARKLIPLQLLILKYAFLIGRREQLTVEEKKGNILSTPEKADFPHAILLYLVQVAASIQRLQAAIMPHAQPGNETNRTWGHLARNIQGLQRCMSSALEEEKEGDEEAQETQKRVLKEKDVRAKLKREAEARTTQQAKDHQMQLFFASILGMGRPYGSSIPIPNRRSRELPITSTLRYAVPVSKAKKLKSSDQAYRAENCGWSWDDDNLLLTTIRRVQAPNMQILQNLLPRYSADEIKHQVVTLKEKSRAYYELQGIVPPSWCDADEPPRKRMRF